MKIQIYIKLFKAIFQGYKGRKIWNQLNKKYNIVDEANYLVLLSTNNPAYNYYFLKGVSECFEPLKKIIILTIDPRIKKVAALFEKRNEFIILDVTEGKVDELIRYYSFTDFYWRFKLVDLDRPYDRKCSQLIGKKGITAEQLIVCGIMDCDFERYKSRIRPQKIPNYNGSNIEIRSFLEDVQNSNIEKDIQTISVS